MKELILIAISAIFVENFVLSKFLGICPFLGVSKKTSTALGMGGAVVFVITLSSAVTWAANKYLLERYGLTYLQTIVFILVIAALVQFVETVLKKVLPTLYSALGIYLPLITTNCAVLGSALLIQERQYTLLNAVVFGFASAVVLHWQWYFFLGLGKELRQVKYLSHFKAFPLR